MIYSSNNVGVLWLDTARFLRRNKHRECRKRRKYVISSVHSKQQRSEQQQSDQLEAIHDVGNFVESLQHPRDSWSDAFEDKTPQKSRVSKQNEGLDTISRQKRL